ncbi:hypothetical protein BpHYR1_034900 [Brachionus plicatilis]|uniref:Uncharacterized protein n=1 Tax=Brachionus plicatilis TaxID=10195 RepID=A0A3M7Q2S9_BRAPC|nr:hypothetical protein BpHYR1_034900 [Brachionus plicatilis]
MVHLVHYDLAKKLAATGIIVELANLQTFGHFFDGRVPFVFVYKVKFVQNNEHLAAAYFANDEAFGCLGLDAFGDVNDQDHHVDDLGAANYCSDQRCMAWTVHQGVLDKVVAFQL